MIDLPLLAKVPFIMNLVMVVWVFVTIALILLILIQKGKGGGLSGAFGGLGAGGLLGTKTGDFLTWVTIGFVVTFLGLAVLLVKFYKPIPPEDPMIPTTPMTLEGAPPTTPGNEGAPATNPAGTTDE
jgi:preprotein translocase subunit SecG